MAKCTAVIVVMSSFFQDQLSSELVAVLPPGALTGTGTIVLQFFFFRMTLGCGYFELLQHETSQRYSISSEYLPPT